MIFSETTKLVYIFPWNVQLIICVNDRRRNRLYLHILSPLTFHVKIPLLKRLDIFRRMWWSFTRSNYNATNQKFLKMQKKIFLGRKCLISGHNFLVLSGPTNNESCTGYGGKLASQPETRTIAGWIKYGNSIIIRALRKHVRVISFSGAQLKISAHCTLTQWMSCDDFKRSANFA